MRKNHILSTIAFATLAFVGCSQDDVLSESSSVNNAIEFGTYLGRDAHVTRATVETTETIGTKGFGVFAYYTKNVSFADVAADASPNFMHNQKVCKEGENWVYSPVKYWPNNPNEMVSFFAYAPYNETAPEIKHETGKLILPFTVADKAADQTDLLWNRADKNIDLKKANISDKVTFTFAHALSRIGFSVEAAVDALTKGKEIAEGTTITIEKIILSGNSYVFAENGGAVTEPSTGVFYPSGDLLLNNPNATKTGSASWSNYGTTKRIYSLSSEDFVADPTLSGNKISITNLNKAENYLMIIPQDFSTDGFYVNIQYKVTTEDNANAANKSEITNYISEQVKVNFESGKAYTFNLVLGMTSVKVQASVDEWDETTPAQKVDLPLNTETTPAV